MSKPFDLKERTRLFATETLKLCSRLPKGSEAGMIRRQLARAAASVGANYRAAQRAKSRRDFVHKLATVEEETDECLYWLDLLENSGFATQEASAEIRHEASELLAIIIACKKTTKKNGL